ncbi:MAG TPA: hypothetical protein VMT24_08640, partial [Aggregatilineaceae bacterium]|nr:hypothetical protein [Aggregatilineaceae bacterium]
DHTSSPFKLRAGRRVKRLAAINMKMSVRTARRVFNATRDGVPYGGIEEDIPKAYRAMSDEKVAYQRR